MPKSKLEQSMEDDEKTLAAESAQEEKEETVEEIESKEDPQPEEKDNEEANRTDDAGHEQEEGEQEKPEDGKPEDGKEGDGKSEGEKEQVLEPKNEDWARIRRENKAMKERLAAASAKPVEERKAVVTDPEPNRAEDPDAWRDWKIAQQDRELARLTPAVTEWQKAKDYQEAGAEIDMHVSRFVKEVPDAKDVLQNAAQNVLRSIKVLNPKMSDVQVQAEYGKIIIKEAVYAHQHGLDIGQHLYDTAVEQFGRPEPVKPAAEKTNGVVKPKPNLGKIDASRRKSATSLVGGGQGSESTALTKAAVAAMSLSEFANVDPKTLAMLEGEAD